MLRALIGMSSVRFVLARELIRSAACSDRSGASTSKRKRLRSLTPSETAELDGGDDDQLRSPLAKRKRLASQRSGISPLKQAISADELTKDLPGELSTIAEVDGAPVGGESDDDDDSDDDDAAFDDDDFLAREFEEMS
jgi:RNA polymerase II subunit A C-terminal domain phosphatase